MSVQQKPVIHGRDHATGGADPIPGLDGGGGIDFDQYNTGGYLDIQAGSGSVPGYGTPSILLESFKTTSYAQAAILLRAWYGVLRMEAKNLYMQLGDPVRGHITFENTGEGLGIDATHISLIPSTSLSISSLRTTEPTSTTEVWEDSGVLCIGPGGAAGGGGGADANYVHTQVAPSASWSVNHGLGKLPAVSVLDTGDNILIPDVHYVDSNNVTLGFAAATSGKAVCN